MILEPFVKTQLLMLSWWIVTLKAEQRCYLKLLDIDVFLGKLNDVFLGKLKCIFSSFFGALSMEESSSEDAKIGAVYMTMADLLLLQD